MGLGRPEGWRLGRERSGDAAFNAWGLEVGCHFFGGGAESSYFAGRNGMQWAVPI